MYTLLIKSPCRIPTQEGSNYHYAGDILEVEDQYYDFIETNFNKYFIVTGYTEDKKPEKKLSKVKVVEEKPKEKSLLQEDTKEIKVTHTEAVPLEEGAHWQEVKAYVLKLEEEVPINLQAIAEVKVKFASYPSVVKECERILSNNNANVK